MTIKRDLSSQIRSVGETVYSTLKELILTREAPPGSPLIEREIAASFNVSTTPVKEALHRLEKEGLVIIKPRIGTYVSPRADSLVEEISWARSSLEGVAARLAAMKITESEAESLGRHIRLMQQSTAQGQAEQIIRLNGKFHLLIRQLARNDYIERQIAAIGDFDRAFRLQALSQSKEWGRAFREHYGIYERIIARDPDGAEESMRAHIRRTARFVGQLQNQAEQGATE